MLLYYFKQKILLEIFPRFISVNGILKLKRNMKALCLEINKYLKYFFAFKKN